MKTKTLKNVLCMAGCALIAMTFVGCAGAQRSAPRAVPVVNMNFERGDYEIQKNVTASSEVTSYLNIVHVIDGDPSKMIIFGYRTFEDQYEEVPSQGVFADALAWIGEMFSGGSPLTRAGYKALTEAEANGADVMIPMRTQTTIRGFKPFYTVRTATVKGKAAVLKEDAANLTK